MRRFSLLGFLIIILFLIAGCTSVKNGAPTGPDDELKKQTITTGTTPTMISTTLSNFTSSFPTVTPQKVMVTLGSLKTIRDSELGFAMQVPKSWEVTTEWLPTPEGYAGLAYRTDLYGKYQKMYDGTYEYPDFYILTYAISRDWDQAMRADNRKHHWNESTVTINKLVFDRYELKTNDTVLIEYIMRKSSANSRGLANVIFLKIESSSLYQQEDLESLLSTFHYISPEDLKSADVEEIKRIGDYTFS